MFFLIRFIAIVGVIFYYSPERARMGEPEGMTLAAIEAPSGDAAELRGASREFQAGEFQAGDFLRSIPQAARDRLAQEIARQLVEDGLALRATLPGRDESAGAARDDAQ